MPTRIVSLQFLASVAFCLSAVSGACKKAEVLDTGGSGGGGGPASGGSGGLSTVGQSGGGGSDEGGAGGSGAGGDSSQGGQGALGGQSGQAGKGGASGRDASAGGANGKDASVEAQPAIDGGAVSCDDITSPGRLAVYYYCDSAASGSSIQMHLDIVNYTAFTSRLSQVTVRYWFTDEAASSANVLEQ